MDNLNTLDISWLTDFRTVSDPNTIYNNQACTELASVKYSFNEIH